MLSRPSQLDFDYTSPPEFDTRKVKSLVASHLALNPEDHSKGIVLGVTTGGKLYNIIMKDKRVGKDLEDGEVHDPYPIKQDLRVQTRRGASSPLSLILLAADANPLKLQSTKHLIPGKVQCVLSPVGYRDEVAKAIAFVL